MAASMRQVKDFHKLLRNCRKSKILHKSGLNYCGLQARFHHFISTNSKNGGVPVLWRNKKSQMCSVFIQRNNSNDVAANTTESMYIPEPPILSSVDIPNTLNALGEPTFASLDLGHNTPAGLVQNALEFLHVSCGLPWWASIVAGTIVIRLMMFPIAVIAGRSAIKMQNHIPEIQKYQLKMLEARKRGDLLGLSNLSYEMKEYMQKNDVNMATPFLVPMAQAPVFFSVFFGLRKMAYLPVESLKTGGLFWFTDLTVPDSFYALPILTMTSLWITLESGQLSTTGTTLQKYFMRIMPIFSLIFVCNFPAAMCCYWFTSNTFSLFQVLILKIPAVKTYLKIPERVEHPPSEQPKPGFRMGIRESWDNSKIAIEVEHRKRAEELLLKKTKESDS